MGKQRTGTAAASVSSTGARPRYRGCCPPGCWSATALAFVVAVWLVRSVYYDVIIDHRTPLDLRPTQLWIESGDFFSYDGFAVWYRASFNPRLEAVQPELRARVGRRPGYTKPVVVLLHGYPGSSFEFAALWQELVRDFDVVTLDFLGCGASDKPYNFPYHVMHQADVVEMLLHDGLGVSQFHVVAHDYGGVVAQELLHRHNQHAFTRPSLQLGSVTFMNAPLFPRQLPPKPLLAALSSHLYGNLLAPWIVGPALFAREFQGGFAPPNRLTPAVVHEHWTMFAYKHGDALLGKMLRFHDDQREFEPRWTVALVDAAIPIKLLVGTADPHQAMLVASDLAALVGPAAVESLAGTVGHYPHMEAPEQVAHVVRAVVADA